MSTHPHSLVWYKQPLWKFREDRSILAALNRLHERDNQRSRLYAAELFQSALYNQSFQDIPAVVSYLQQLTTTHFYRRRFPHVGSITVYPRVHGGAVSGFTGYSNGKLLAAIYLPPNSLTEWIVLHELAHASTPPETGSRHGRYFARAYLDLILTTYGTGRYNQLRASFQRHGVKFSPKRPPSHLSLACIAARPKIVPPRDSWPSK